MQARLSSQALAQLAHFGGNSIPSLHFLSATLTTAANVGSTMLIC